MGYWGCIVVAKGGDTLAGHPAVVAYGGGGVLEEYRWGDWREIWLDDAQGVGGGSVEAVVRATGAPALAVFVLDEDCAVMEAASPSGECWVGVFVEEVAYEYEVVPPGYDRAQAVASAVRWAAEAGLVADAGRVEEALADGWYDDLLSAFGLPDRV